MVKNIHAAPIRHQNILAAQAQPLKQGRPAPRAGDELVEAGQGAPVALTKGQSGVGVGRTKKPSKKPALEPLTKEELRSIGERGSIGMKGTGTLRGKISLERGRPYLITSGAGTRSEVKFRLDLNKAKAEALEGKTVYIGGNIHKTETYAGKIDAAKIVIPAKAQKVGDHFEVTGKAFNINLEAIGGEAPPQGTYIKLDRPISVGGKVIKELHLWNEEFKDGDKIRLYGRLDKKEYGGVETKKTEYFELSGTSDLEKGEPRFDGKDFLNARGEKLDVLSYDRPQMFDAPSQVYVVDPDSHTIFQGARGGHVPPWVNPWHGFRDSAPIGAATDADRAAVKFDRQGNASIGATKLDLIGRHETRPGVSDPMTTQYYLDPNTRTVYSAGFGGQVGFRGRLLTVTRFDE